MLPSFNKGSRQEFSRFFRGSDGPEKAWCQYFLQEYQWRDANTPYKNNDGVKKTAVIKIKYPK